MEKVFLVSCVAKKRPERSPAAELYLSPWFNKARAYVEKQGGRWYILSAEHGLIRPDRSLDPYDTTLNNMRVAERRAWATRVAKQIRQDIPKGCHVVILAGQRYREHLLGTLEEVAERVSVPMEGLGIGQQLAWLDRNIK